MQRRHIRTGGYLALTALFGWLFHVRYWQWRDCIQEALSSCITPDGATLIEGGPLWALPALLCAAAALSRMVRK